MDPFTTLTGTDRCTIRRDILRDLGDLLLLTATQDGDENTFVDEVNLNAEVGGYQGREAYFCGTRVPTVNEGQTRYVVDSSRSQHALAFSVALPGPTHVGDECELVNLRGVGTHVAQVNEAINESIRFAQRHSIYALSTAEIEADTTNGTYAVPPEYRTVEHVYFTDWSGKLSPLNRVDSRAEAGWLVDRANRTIALGAGSFGGGSYSPYGYSPTTLRLDGLAEPLALEHDHEKTRIDAEWLVYQTEATLARARFLRSPTPETQAVMGMLQNQANALRENLAVRRSPFSVELGPVMVMA